MISVVTESHGKAERLPPRVCLSAGRLCLYRATVQLTVQPNNFNEGTYHERKIASSARTCVASRRGLLRSTSLFGVFLTSFHNDTRGIFILAFFEHSAKHSDYYIYHNLFYIFIYYNLFYGCKLSKRDEPHGFPASKCDVNGERYGVEVNTFSVTHPQYVASASRSLAFALGCCPVSSVGTSSAPVANARMANAATRNT